MLGKLTICQILFVLSMISCEIGRTKRGKKKNENLDKALWKKQYEEELTDAMLSVKKHDNVTRTVQSFSDNELVIEKLMEAITSSEKYLKKIDSMDFRLNRLDIEVHEKTNTILKKLSDVSKALSEQLMADKVEMLLDTLRSDISHIKFALEPSPRKAEAVEGPGFQGDASIENRLLNLENLVRGVMSGVDSIVATMAEVKGRQTARVFNSNNAKSESVSSPFENLGMITEFRKLLHDQRYKKCDCSSASRSGRVDRSERYPTDCHEIQMQGFNISGIYKIKPEEIEPFYILCDLTTSGGGWTVFQNRYDGSQDFFKGWSDYKYGFGNLAGEFWLGLEKLNFLTNQKLYELRIELESQHGQEPYAAYSVFTVGPEHEGFRISTLGTYYGTAGDSLSYHAGQKFSTFDNDNDEWKDGSCATEHGGAWWYKECDKSNLNGKFTTTAEENRGQSIYWTSFKGPNNPLTKTKMMIRPLPASKPVDFTGNRKIELPKPPFHGKSKNVLTKDLKKNSNRRARPTQYHFEAFPETFMSTY